MAERLLYSIQETCFALSLGQTKVYELIGEGRLETVKIGKRTLITAASLSRTATEGSPVPR